MCKKSPDLLVIKKKRQVKQSVTMEYVQSFFKIVLSARGITGDKDPYTLLLGM